MTKKGYQPKMVYGKPNPNYSGPDKASDLDDDTLVDLGKNVKFADSEYEEDTDEAIDRVDEKVRNVLQKGMDSNINNNGLGDYVKFYSEGEYFHSDEFIDTYTYDIYEDTYNDYDSRPMQKIDEYTAIIDTKTGDEIVDRVNERFFNSYFHNTSNARNEIESIKVVDGEVIMPASYIVSDEASINGLTKTQNNRVNSFFALNKVMRSDNPVLDEYEYDYEVDKKINKDFEKTNFLGNIYQSADNHIHNYTVINDIYNGDRINRLSDNFTSVVDIRVAKSDFKDMVLDKYKKSIKDSGGSFSNSKINPNDYREELDQVIGSIDLSEYDDEYLFFD